VPVAKAETGVTEPAAGPQVATAPPATDPDGYASGHLPLTDAIVERPLDAPEPDPEEVVDDRRPIDPGTDPSSNAQSAQSQADSVQTEAGNGNVSVRIGQAGSSGAVTQTNDVSAVAKSRVDSNWGSGSPGTNQTQASASAKATQTAPSNSNIAVRVDSPGDNGDITQSNSSFAGAQAGGTTGAATAGTSGNANASPNEGRSGGGTAGTDGGQNSTSSVDTNHALGEASAIATQTAPSNINVVVRVASPGDNGTVDQTNTVTAAAGSSTPAKPGMNDGTGAAGVPFGTDQTITTSGSADASNDGDLIQEIEQMQHSEGRPGEATPPGAASIPDEGFTNGTAAASQDGASNANVSVRVGSPGSDGAVQQGNGATATGTTSMVTVASGSNVDVAVAVAGSSGAPDGAWTWNWEWDGAWTLPALPGADVAPTAASIWNWMWKADLTGAATTLAPVTTTTATLDAPDGTWTWNWTWIFADGSTRQLTWNEACECAWAWNWTWDWSKQSPASVVPPPAPSSPRTATAAEAERVARAFDPAIDDGAVSQTNAVSAEATSTVELSTLSETTVTKTGGQDSWADQRIQSSQAAQALSEATQEDPWNLNLVWGVPVESVLQWNEVEAVTTAKVSARISQAIVQEQNGNGPTVQSVEAEQWLNNTQVAVAVAQSAQATARNVDRVSPPSSPHGAVRQSNSASSAAASTIEATIAQWIGQLQDGGVATLQHADATQFHVNSQDGLAVSQVAQARTTNLNDAAAPHAGAPTAGQRNEAFVTTAVLDTSVIDGWIHQAQGGVADSELARARQEGIVAQTNMAYAPASQSDLLNHAAWGDVAPPAEQPVADDADDAAIEQPTNTSAGPSDGGGAGPSPTVFTPRAGLRDSDSRTGSHRDILDRSHDDRHGWQTGSHVPLRGPTGALDNGSAAGSSEAPNAPEPRAPAPPTALDLSPRTGTSGRTQVSASVSPGSRQRAHHSPPSPGSEDWSGFGASSTAPPSGGGSGPSVLTLGRYELAAPEGLGPHLFTLIPERSGASVEPFEWPG
jgi:hypothetical protein